MDNRLLYSALLITIALVISALLSYRAAWWRRGRHVISRFVRHPITRELGTLALLWAVFVATIMYPTLSPERSALEATWSGGGIEYERLAGVIIPIEIGLTRYGHLPTWNPYMNSGIPTLGDAFSYLFNPFSSLPPLLLGAVQGVKVSMMLALLIAAWNAWALAKALGVGTVGRVTAGALYMASGGMAGKFHPGHVQLAISLAWVPLVLAAAWWTLRSKSRFAPVGMGIAFALLFYCGNIYYTLHTILCAGFITALHVIERQDERWRWRGDRLRRMVIGGAFAFGLSALQFIPVWMVHNSISHHQTQINETTGTLLEQYSLERAALNFIYPYPAWGLFEQEGVSTMLVGVDYSYIGLVPFLLIGAGAAALTRTRQPIPLRTASVALCLAIAMMIWGAGQSSIIQWLYTNVELVAEFRFVGRAHAIAALWFIMLAGFAMDALWHLVTTSERFAAYERQRLLRILTVGVLLWAAYTLYSAQDDDTRFNIARRSADFLYILDYIRFTSMKEASDALWFVVLAFPLFDMALMALVHLVWRAWARRIELNWRGYALRLSHMALLFIACVGFADLFNTNSGLFWYARRFADFVSLYQHIRAVDPNNPYPDLNEPETQMLMFQSYYNEVRNRALDEGWQPRAVPGVLLVGAGLEFNSFARWVIGFSFDSPIFRDYQYEVQQCARNLITGETMQPNPVTECNFFGEVPGLLYVRPQALPYAFIASSHMLLLRAQELTPQSVQMPLTIEHQQDTITLRAAQPPPDDSLKPPDLPNYYLVVQETHFPGWQAFVDGVPVQLTSIYNYIGIPMQAGEHTYTLRYQPPGLAAGIVIFVITLAVVGFYLHAKETRMVIG